MIRSGEHAVWTAALLASADRAARPASITVQITADMRAIVKAISQIGLAMEAAHKAMAGALSTYLREAGR